MKLSQFQKWVNNLPKVDLNKSLGYYSPDYGLSGVVLEIKQSDIDLYYLGDDDPATLYSKNELIHEHGYTEEEVNNFMIEIHKGDYLIIF